MGIANKKNKPSVLQPEELDSTKSNLSSKENFKVKKFCRHLVLSWEKRNRLANYLCLCLSDSVNIK